MFLAVLSALAVGQNSGGCGASPPSQPRAGSTSALTIKVGSLTRSYRLHRPSGHGASTPAAPVVFSFHGWGSSSSFNEGYMGLTATSDANGFFAVYPEGRSDYGRDTNNGWQSFNAVGSTDSPKSNAPECTRSTSGYCYQSCASRSQGCGQCDWTSCADDNAFTAALLDHLEKTYCIDTARIFATGYSNGGMMVYELGMSLTSRFAALVPGGGQPFVGHNNAPPINTGGYLSVLDLHGTNDRTCPANATTSSDGWNYEPVDNVLTVWADALGCSSPASTKKFNTPEDSSGFGLYCVEFGNCPTGVDVVRCSYTAGHDWLDKSRNGGAGARLAWWFFENHPKAPWRGGNSSITSSVV